MLTITNEQRTTLDELRNLLAEVGYRIFPVAEWYRRDESDFVAISNDGIVRHLFVVRAVGNGTVSIRPFSSSTRSSTIGVFLKLWHKRISVRVSVWAKRYLPRTRDKGTPSWLPYLDEDSRREWLALA